jgi:hypothetical protein
MSNDETEYDDYDGFEDLSEHLAEAFGQYDSTNFDHSHSMGELLDEGVNCGMIGNTKNGVVSFDEYVPPDPSALSAKQLGRTQLEDLRGFFEITNSSPQGDELDPLTNEEARKLEEFFGDLDLAAMSERDITSGLFTVLAKYEEKDKKVLRYDATIRNLSVRKERTEEEDKALFWAKENIKNERPSLEILLRKEEAILKKELSQEKAMEEQLSKIDGIALKAANIQLDGLRSEIKARKETIKRWQDLLPRLRISLERDNIGTEWSWQCINGIGHRPGVVEDQATQNSEGSRLAQDEPDDLHEAMGYAWWQEDSQKSKVYALVDNLWAAGNCKKDEDGNGRDTVKGAKLLGPAETLYFSRSQEQREVRFDAIMSTLQEAKTLKKVQDLRTKVNHTYSKSMGMCVPMTAEGSQAKINLVCRGYTAEQLSKNVKLTRCQSWHKLYLTKKQKADVMAAITEKMAQLKGKTVQKEQPKMEEVRYSAPAPIRRMVQVAA